MPAREDEILTPSQLNTLARDLLEGAFPLVWVEAELGNVTRPSSGHLYFTLKDARAQVRCAMFKPKSQWLKFQPREGLRVLARGRLTLYEARGDYQMVLDHLEEAGEGALRREFEQLRARLAAEGLFDSERKRPLPAHVRRLAVITSPSGAAVRDVLSVLARRFPMLEVELLPSLVQGESAAAQLTSLLRRADASGRYEVILLTRGGGSLEDLWAFNDETLARAIAASATPVVSAVGHENRLHPGRLRRRPARAPTPSVAAELLVPDQREFLARVRRAQAQLLTSQRHWLRQSMQRADRAGLRLEAQAPRARLQLLRASPRGRHAPPVRAMRGQLERLQARFATYAQARQRQHDPARRLASFGNGSARCACKPRWYRDCAMTALRLRVLRWARSLEADQPAGGWLRAATPSSSAAKIAAWCAAPQVHSGGTLRMRALATA